MTDPASPVDPRPRPKYGEYAPIPPTPHPSPVVETPVVTDAAAPRPRRTWDLVLTTTLLLIAVYDVVGGYATYADLGPALADAYTQQGFGEFTAFESAREAGAALTVARIVILVLTVAVSLLLIAKRRTAFWAPLVGGALAGIALLVCVFTVVLNDPVFAQFISERS